jgi:hypothetical protein
MVAVVKWLRQWIVIPSCAGSNPVSHPTLSKTLVLNQGLLFFRVSIYWDRGLVRWLS